MMIKTTALQATLLATCLISIGLCEARENQVAWLRDVQKDASAGVPELEALNGTLYEIPEVIPMEESFTGTEKRDPKRKKPKTGGKNNGTDDDDDDDDDSGAGKADISMPLSIGAGLVILTMFLQY